MQVEGRRLHWRQWGDPQAPPVLLLHASGCHSGWWEWSAPGLAPEFWVIAPDLRGHGDSSPAGDYGWGAYVSDLVALARGLGITRAAVVGHSMGGYVGLRLAADHPDLVAALVVADMKTEATPTELAALAETAVRPSRVYPTLEEAVQRYRLQPAEHRVPDDRLQQIATENMCRQADGWVQKFDRRHLAYAPLEADALVARLRCSGLMVRGEHSSIMSRDRAEALARAAGALFAELPGTYHHLMLEDPAAFNAQVLPFLRRHWVA